ncbi:cbb3-type cytochrome c oxidase subunit I [Pampinifervens florentissimum]|uniref:cbb3-type cytochrome c oxidase subunit I n=1 Tax=Pampinifervens florentissimum TaxID=1632019 RepID=UPI0013B49276|nr:cbb3-type cytochrome c oxidase subunit I [Hydrogenobacter sp. T-8]QID33388.1 cytochrome C oxidase subunit I [Hydrogenobacter sp. T-8]
MHKKWLLLSIVSLGLGGLLALVAAIARTPAVYKLVPPGYFYHSIIGHVDLAIVGFFLTFSLLLWQLTFREELKTPLYFSLGGIFLIALVSLLGVGKGVSNNYLPTIDHPLFWLGALFFFAGFWLGGFGLLARAEKGIFSENPRKHLASISILLSIFMLLAFLTSIPKAGSREELYLFYERLYWAPGHIHQFINGVMLLYAWYYLFEIKGIKLELGRLRYVSFLFLSFCFMYVFIPIVFADPVSESARRLTDLGYAVGLGLPIFFHIYFLLKNYKMGKDLYSTAFFISLVLYLLGVFIAYAGVLPSLVSYFINPSSEYIGMKSNLSIPAHYHGVITSQTLAFMTIAYHLFKELGYTQRLSKLSLPQVYLYGTGMVLFVLGLFFAGLRNAPRKTYGTGFTDDPLVLMSLGLMGIGTLLAVAGGVIFVLYSLKVLFGRSSPQ